MLLYPKTYCNQSSWVQALLILLLKFTCRVVARIELLVQLVQLVLNHSCFRQSESCSRHLTDQFLLPSLLYKSPRGPSTISFCKIAFRPTHQFKLGGGEFVQIPYGRTAGTILPFTEACVVRTMSENKQTDSMCEVS